MCTMLPCCVLFADWKFQFGCCKTVGELIPDLEAKKNAKAAGVDVVVSVNGAPEEVEMEK